ncbi:hypothetical protein RD792_010185 [Penstemon davidsonii]|uniref:Formin-like protein n=1 Tax=Penstemon davidsonii TaxID=160366 RepID=A0ABR0D141_9LAMI|nr:hypothetical protein RD792_010185 [Penstemon davidsonii]
MPTALLFLLLHLSAATTTTTFHHRRVLHQPFFPLDTQPSPPKYPFSTSTPTNTPFFHSYPSPPPPTSFPANSSSLDVPHPPKSKSKYTSSILIIFAVAAAAAAILILSFAFFLHLRKKRPPPPPHPSLSSSKTQRSDSSATTPSNIPKLQRPSQTSSEFLYLGTLVNSHPTNTNIPTASNNNTDSPELRPLPPLNTPSQQGGHRIVDVASSIDEDEEFYSPKGSSSIGIDSASRRGFDFAIQIENFNGSTSNSSSTYSGPGSPERSVSSSLSPPNSMSPENSIPKSPDLIEIQTISPLHQQMMSPLPPPPPPRPPSLITPLRPFAVENPTLISPIELLPLASNDSESPNKEKEREQNNEITRKPKLKPLHWDKVRASSDREMVWDQLKSSSFKLNEEMIETLFVVNAPKPSPKEGTRWQVLPSPGLDNNGNNVLDPKKAQNIAILLRALNVTVEEVCEGLLEGNVSSLGTELLESLLKMAPTKEEERKLKDYKDDSPAKLGAAEKFLKAVLDIPYAFKRVDAMLYVSNFESEVEYLKKSFQTLEAACEELRSSRMLLKLLEAILKTGNRMNVGTNRGDAHAFKLDALLKLVDIKGADGKTTLLHFVVQEIIISEGARLSNGTHNENDDPKCKKLGLQVVSSISSELSNVRKSAAMDAEVLRTDVSKLSNGIRNIGEIERLNGSCKFSDSMKCFTKKAEEEIIRIKAQERVALSLVKEISEYFHGNSGKEEAHPFRIFMVVRDFLTTLDRVCKEVGTINEQMVVSLPRRFPVPVNPMLQPVLGGFQNRKEQTLSDERALLLDV